jgi:ribosome-binding protein aMBF1 (putative translation factor)
MKTNKNLTSIDALMDAKFGKVGTAERSEFRSEAYTYCVAKIIHDARKSEKITQEELARRTETSKSYISKIENGLVEPGAGTFYRIMDSMGLQIEIAKPVF